MYSPNSSSTSSGLTDLHLTDLLSKLQAPHVLLMLWFMFLFPRLYLKLMTYVTLFPQALLMEKSKLRSLYRLEAEFPSRGGGFIS